MLIVSQFIATYGYDTFQNGAITWVTFWTLYNRIPNIQAFHRVNMTTSVALGAGLALGGEKVMKYTEQDRKEALGV